MGVSTPASPDMGGAWERMVREIKTALYITITLKTKLTDETLQNLLVEVESITNSRPLTYLSLETAVEEVLTPNHFLLGSSSGQKQPGKFVPTDEFLKRSWRYIQYLADNFWKRWMVEYWHTLTHRTKWFVKEEALKAGDVVIICDPNCSRYTWPKEIIQTAIMGSDGQSRSTDVKAETGLYHRPTAKLAKINVSDADLLMKFCPSTRVK